MGLGDLELELDVGVGAKGIDVRACVGMPIPWFMAVVW
jgi:hypothetical protein